MQDIFSKVLEELEVESAWARKHCKDPSHRQGRISGLETAKRIIAREARIYNEKQKDKQ